MKCNHELKTLIKNSNQERMIRILAGDTGYEDRASQK